MYVLLNWMVKTSSNTAKLNSKGFSNEVSNSFGAGVVFMLS